MLALFSGDCSLGQLTAEILESLQRIDSRKGPAILQSGGIR